MGDAHWEGKQEGALRKPPPLKLRDPAAGRRIYPVSQTPDPTPTIPSTRLVRPRVYKHRPRTARDILLTSRQQYPSETIGYPSGEIYAHVDRRHGGDDVIGEQILTL